MVSEWKNKKLSYKGNALSWEEKDSIQRLLSVAQSDAVDALNTSLEYGYILDFTNGHPAFMDKAPNFWSEIICALRFSTVMKAARFFDVSKDAVGLNKIYHILENSIYYGDVKKELVSCKEQYSAYRTYIDEIRTLRDTVYAHNDKKEYQFWKREGSSGPDLEFDGSFWSKINDMLRWVRDSLLRLRTCIGDDYPVNIEIDNDVYKLLTFDYEDKNSD